MNHRVSCLLLIGPVRTVHIILGAKHLEVVWYNCFGSRKARREVELYEQYLFIPLMHIARTNVGVPNFFRVSTSGAPMGVYLGRGDWGVRIKKESIGS